MNGFFLTILTAAPEPSAAADVLPTPSPELEQAIAEKTGGFSAWLNSKPSIIFYVLLVFLLAAIFLLVALLRYNNLREKQHAHTAAKAPRQRTITTLQPFKETKVADRAPEASAGKSVFEEAPEVKDELPVAAAYYQDIGRRQNQQDSFAITTLYNYNAAGVLAIVADGMGGLANGALVSRALTESFVGGFQQNPSRPPVGLLLEEAIKANVKINDMLIGAEKSGSTLISVIIKDGSLSFISVGDSRIYLWRGNAMLQLTREHIFQEELLIDAVNMEIKPEQITTDPQAKALTSYFGVGHIPHFDRNYEPIKLLRGDRVLLMSDGIFGTLSIEEMEAAMQYDVASAAEALGRMVKDKNTKYQDNNTVVILEYRG